LFRFIFNKNWTFETKKVDIKTEFIKFLPVNLVSLGFTLIGIELLNGMFVVNIYLAKVIVTIFAQLLNYFGYKVWVFEGKSKNKIKGSTNNGK
jgi:putative flippase GtrA